MTKAQIEERKAQELNVDLKDVQPPSYLTARQKKEFNEIAGKLLQLNIMTELDEDSLARYLVAQDQYLEANKMYRRAVREKWLIDDLDKITRMQDRAFKQCRASASDLGLTISSRAKLVVPKAEEPKQNKFLAKFGGESTG
ncbi:phage terminase small subunit P27 family [Proteiniclasticum sp. BAD-10]|uniref:Phage terminase small subunit P27 family n=2 Tax=Proteiniclasticum sediminis TaxID=2804028 RepID=A0A941CQY3_9CLOT|nr:phage terminase small subunit P27 family [Proteiniclasticum sediminis]MBR0575691.1 phage terminase small subunit P27 family [Proteiniclasticum sediminis]